MVVVPQRYVHDLCNPCPATSLPCAATKSWGGEEHRNRNGQHSSNTKNTSSQPCDVCFACVLIPRPHRGVKPGDRYLTVMCGNTKRKTAVVQGMSEFVCPEVFHFLIKGTNSAVVEILLKEKETIGNDKMLGSFKVMKRQEYHPLASSLLFYEVHMLKSKDMRSLPALHVHRTIHVMTSYRSIFVGNAAPGEGGRGHGERRPT